MLDLSCVRITVTGGSGFLGQAVCETLRQRGCRNIGVPRRREYDLTTVDGVRRMYEDFQPEIIIHLAAEVGGIGANRENPGRFFFANSIMGLLLIEEARIRDLQKFVFTGTVCAYPKFAPVPFNEADIWNGYPEETNAPYGVAKKSLFVMLDGYKRQYGLNSAVAVPVNLYGPRDNFDLRSSHVIPALVRKFIEARDSRQPSVACWGTGLASREFLYVDDAAEGIVRMTELIDDPAPINLGTGSEVTIRDLAHSIARRTGFHGRIEWVVSEPDGQPRRCLDTGLAQELLDWKARVGLEEGLRQTIEWYERHRIRQAA